MIYIIAVLIVLGPLVFVHELGHYLAAKLFGVRVEVFSIGFGKRLWGFRRGDTDYRLSALPFGGYVRMSGENPMEEHAGEPYEFGSHPRWQRFVIAIAGPLTNILFSVALLTGVFMTHYVHPAFLDLSPAIAYVDAGSAAAKAGIEAGDRITQVDGKPTATWDDVVNRMLLDADQDARITLQRGNQAIPATVHYSQPESNPIDFLGVEPDQPYIVGRLEADFPAAKAGLRVGDEILSVNGIPVHGTPGIARVLQQAHGAAVQIQAKRDGGIKTFTVAPSLDNSLDPPRYRIGVGEPTRTVRLPFLAAFETSVALNKQYSMMIVDVLQRLLRKKVSLKQMSGPIGIAQQSGEALREGPLVFLGTMALISLNLGIFNLLPIPILDGGLILLLVIEGLMRRDIKREVKEMVYQAAFVFIIVFAVIVIYNDITKTALGKLLHLG